jgi:hypothetical protein
VLPGERRAALAMEREGNGYTNAKYYFVQSVEGFSMQGKEPKRYVAALH